MILVKWTLSLYNMLLSSDKSAAAIVSSLFCMIFLGFSITYAIIHPRKKSNNSQRCVVITGCDTGFGFSLSIELTRIGYHVISACLTHEGASSLKDKVADCLVCDVTNTNHITKLSEATTVILKQHNISLWALINNAGIAPVGCLDWMSVDSYRKAIEVNYLGPIAVTKAMLPFLKLRRGSRVITLSSVAGVTGPPLFGPYSGVFDFI